MREYIAIVSCCVIKYIYINLHFFLCIKFPGTNRGQADGFGLEILPKLRDVKSRDNTRNLLQYLVMQYVRKFDEDAWTEQAKLPLPEPSDISKSAMVNFEDLEVDIDKASKSLNGLFLYV